MAFSTTQNGVNPRGFLWEAGVFTALDTSLFTVTQRVQAISEDGNVVVGWFGVITWRWEAGVTQELGLHSVADTNADGSVIVGELAPGVGGIWVGGQLFSLEHMLEFAGLDTSGWDLDQLTAVSDDDLVFAGTGTNPAGNREGWVLRVDALPEPSTGLLVGIGLVLLALRRRSAA